MPQQEDWGDQGSQDHQEGVFGRQREDEVLLRNRHSEAAGPPEHSEALRSLPGREALLPGHRAMHRWRALRRDHE